MSVQLAGVVPDADGDDGHGVGGLDDGKLSQSQLSKSSSRPWSREVAQHSPEFSMLSAFHELAAGHRCKFF